MGEGLAVWAGKTMQVGVARWGWVTEGGMTVWWACDRPDHLLKLGREAA